MDERKILILHLPSNSTKWYDATKKISWYKDAGNCWLVKFSNRENYSHVSFSNMRVFENPEKLEFAEVFYKKQVLFRIKEVLCFGDNYYKLFFEEGDPLFATPKEVKVVKDTLKESDHAQGVMDYYQEVVKETAESEEDSFLINQFETMTKVNEESVLSLYLEGKLGKNNSPLQYPTISPFGTNLSQSKALKMMFENRISIVEGPPGTGKTQTILNFIANALVNGKTVAIVSNNNSATDNVYEKLEKNGYSFLAAPLGNVDNVEKFFEEYKTTVPTFEKKPVRLDTIINLYYGLPSAFENENKKKKDIEKLAELELEYKHFLAENADVDFTKVKIQPERVKSESVLAFMIRLKESNKRLSFWTKLILRHKLKLKKAFFEIDADDYIIYLNNLFYLSKINEVKKEIKTLTDKLNNQTFEEKLKRYVEASKIFFENQLSSLFSGADRGKYGKDNYKRQFSDFVKDYPVILSSTYSLARCSQKGFLFDYLVVDESSQVNMASAILSMGVAKNLISVGDIKQLPQIDDNGFKDRNEELLKKFKVSRTYSYYGNSIMSSLLSLYGDKIPRTMLKEHYRCNPDIISFCNKKFYDNELVVYTKPKDDEYSMKVIKTVEGNFARKNPNGTGLYNQREIDEIKSLLDKENLEDVGVISPYRHQAEVVTEQLGDKVDASTIHKFQGREKKTIIFSSVINSSNEFVENDNLINVAVSRAVDRFILVTSDKVAKSNKGILSDLVNYISYNNEFGTSEEGTVRSIYDLLYEDYQEQLAKFRKRHPSKDFDSENLTKELILNILKDKEFGSFGLRMHVSLKDFIQAKGLHLTDEEYKFFRNPNSHADFLVYNKMSKKPSLVIEVDGIAYHEQSKKQQERDTKKNSILDKAGVKILRLKTNESNEESRIRTALIKMYE